MSIHLDYSSTIRDIISSDSEDKKTLLKQFTRFTYYSLLQNNVHHLDYSRGNILITDSKYMYKFSIVDINRMKFEKMGYQKGLETFSKLWAEEEELEIIGKEYAKLTDKSVDETVKKLKILDTKHKLKINRKKKVKEWVKEKI